MLWFMRGCFREDAQRRQAALSVRRHAQGSRGGISSSGGVVGAAAEVPFVARTACCNAQACLFGFVAVAGSAGTADVAARSSQLLETRTASCRQTRKESAFSLRCLQRRPKGAALLPTLAFETNLWPGISRPRGEIATDVVQSYDLTLRPSVLARSLPGELVYDMDIRSLEQMRNGDKSRKQRLNMLLMQQTNDVLGSERSAMRSSREAAAATAFDTQRKRSNQTDHEITLDGSFMIDHRQQGASSADETASPLSPPMDPFSERCAGPMIIEHHESTQVSLAYHFRNMRSLAARRRWADPFYRHRVLEARRRTLNRKRRVAAALARAESNQSTIESSESDPKVVRGTEPSKEAVVKHASRRSRRAGPVESITLVDEKRAKELIAYAQSNAKRAQKHRQLQADRIGWMQQRLASGAEKRQRLLDPAYKASLQRRRSEIAFLRHTKTHRKPQ
jgi:hypothetical protein